MRGYFYGPVKTAEIYENMIYEWENSGHSDWKLLVLDAKVGAMINISARWLMSGEAAEQDLSFQFSFLSCSVTTTRTSRKQI